ITPCQFFPNVVGVQKRHPGCILKSIAAERRNVTVSAHENAKIAKKGTNPAHRLGTMLLQLESITVLDNTRYWEKLAESARYRHRTRPRPAPALRRRTRLVHVSVPHIGAHLSA